MLSRLSTCTLELAPISLLFDFVLGPAVVLEFISVSVAVVKAALFIFILESIVVSSAFVISELSVLFGSVTGFVDSIFLYLFTSPATACLK